MAASGVSCLQVLTASNLTDAVHKEPELWNSYLEAAEEEKELAWARIADIFGLNNGMCTSCAKNCRIFHGDVLLSPEIDCNKHSPGGGVANNCVPM